MPWPLILLSETEWKVKRKDIALMPGHCCYAPWILVPKDNGEDDWRKSALGRRYWNLPDSPERPRRAPILIALPDGGSDIPTIWCPDQMAWDGVRGSHGDGWDVTGTLPILTCMPSINYPGRFHAWIRDGFVTDDCEGRKFTACGREITARPPSDGDSSKDATGSHPTIPGVSPSGLHKRPPGA